MKILFIFNHAAPYKVKLLNELSSHHQFDVIFERIHNSDRPKEFYSDDKFNFNLIKINGVSLGNENFVSNGIKSYIKKHHKEYDLIIFNGYSTIAEMNALNYVIKHKIPYVLYINGGIIKNSGKLKESLKTKYISNASYYFSPCEEADDFLKHYGAKNKIFHYPYSTVFVNELHEPLLKDEKEKLRKEYNITSSNRVFVYSGQFINRKNNMQLLEIWRQVSKQYALYLIGCGKEQKVMERFILEHHLKNVHILPFMKKENLLNFFRACDVFITLSKEDIYGHMINEALSQSLPVISSNRVISAKHLIKNGYNGFLVDIDDENAIKKALTMTIHDEMKKNCYNTAESNTIETMTLAHIDALKEIENENILSNNILDK